MNRFRFRLESVLRVRQAREDESAREFGTAAGHLARERQRHNEIESAMTRHDHDSAEYSEGPVSAARLMQNFRYARELERRRDVQAGHVREAETVADEKREVMVEAMKKRKTIERLKERQREQYEQDVRLEEQAFIDETATQRFSDPDNN